MDPELGPDLKLAAALERWPQLEGVLRALSPAYVALDDPLLREKLSKAATLRQVARAAGIPLGALLAAFRRAVGQPPAPPPDETSEGAPPPWARADRVAGRRDARDDVGQGVHPLPLVLADLEALPDGAVYELLTPLVPAPLIDLAARRGYDAHTVTGADGVRTYFMRRAGSPGPV